MDNYLELIQSAETVLTNLARIRNNEHWCDSDEKGYIRLQRAIEACHAPKQDPNPPLR